ncbi:SoxR reducing system RseC family protein [Colwellia sp. E150_009]
MEELATVTAIDNENITMVSKIKSTCNSCSQVDTCASGQVAKAIPKKTLSFTLTKPKLMESTTINIGDCVVLTVPDGNVLHSAWQVYLLPVFGLFSFSALGQWLLQESILSHELVGVALGLVGGYLGYRVAKRLQSNSSKQNSLQPEILKVLAKPIDVNTLSSD